MLVIFLTHLVRTENTFFSFFFFLFFMYLFTSTAVEPANVRNETLHYYYHTVLVYTAAVFFFFFIGKTDAYRRLRRTRNVIIIKHNTRPTTTWSCRFDICIFRVAYVLKNTVYEYNIISYRVRPILSVRADDDCKTYYIKKN